MFTRPVSSVITGIGYADNLDEIPINIMKNAVVSRFTNGIQKIPFLPQHVRDFGQNVASWYLLNQENEDK